MPENKDRDHHNSTEVEHLCTTDPDVQINGENIKVVNSERLPRGYYYYYYFKNVYSAFSRVKPAQRRFTYNNTMYNLRIVKMKLKL